MDKEIFGLGDEVWNIALIGPREGVSKVKACEKLVELSESVGDVITASKILRDAPKQVRVKASNLEAFKDVFETAEFFHYQRWLLPFLSLEKCGSRCLIQMKSLGSTFT